jgi:hypothetical protein
MMLGTKMIPMGKLLKYNANRNRSDTEDVKRILATRTIDQNLTHPVIAYSSRPSGLQVDVGIVCVACFGSPHFGERASEYRCPLDLDPF